MEEPERLDLKVEGHTKPYIISKDKIFLEPCKLPTGKK